LELAQQASSLNTWKLAEKVVYALELSLHCTCLLQTVDLGTMDLDNRSWTDYFFSGCQPSFDLAKYNLEPENFRQFQHNQNEWRLGRSLRADTHGSPALVLWLYVRTRGLKAKYVAKTVRYLTPQLLRS
jgi:hypothetical protein